MRGSKTGWGESPARVAFLTPAFYPLQLLWSLSNYCITREPALQAASSAVCSHLPYQANTMHEELHRSFAAQFELQAQAQVDGVGKFSV